MHWYLYSRNRIKGKSKLNYLNNHAKHPSLKKQI